MSFFTGLGIRYDGYDSNDFAVNELSNDEVFEGYDKPDTETVINFGMSYGWLFLEASSDISNQSKSNIVSLSLEVPAYESESGFSIFTTTTAHWLDANYINYYYGIICSQANESFGRIAYHAHSAMQYEIGIKTVYPVNKNWALIGSENHAILSKEKTNSPLIDSDYQDKALLLIAYQFSFFVKHLQLSRSKS